MRVWKGVGSVRQGVRTGPWLPRLAAFWQPQTSASPACSGFQLPRSVPRGASVGGFTASEPLFYSQDKHG